MKREGWGGLAAIAVICLALSGCASKPDLTDVSSIEVKTADVAVTTKCVPDKLGPDPQYADSPEAVRAAANVYERVKLILAGRLQRIERDKEKSAALAACGAPIQ
jgi:hypothetical protein